MYVCMYVYVCNVLYVYMWVCVCMYLYICIRMCVYVYIHTYFDKVKHICHGLIRTKKLRLFLIKINTSVLIFIF